MQQRALSDTFKVGEIGLGCMGMSEFYGPRDDTQSLSVLHRAIELGVDFFDTADMYGSGHNEELVGQFLSEATTRPKIATKFGIRRNPGEYARSLDNSPAYARASCEASLKRLGLEHIDLFYVHRLDRTQPVEDVMGELSKLVDEGKIGHIGLCEVSAATLKRAHAIHPVTALQTEYSLWSRDVEEEILPTCTKLGIGFVPYSPLGRGFLTGSFDKTTEFEEGDFRAGLPRFLPDNIEQNTGIVQVLRRIARRRDMTPAQLALAWVLSKGERIVPIPGTRRIKYLEENISSANLKLTQDEVQELEENLDKIEIHGQRYTEEGMKGVSS